MFSLRFEENDNRVSPLLLITSCPDNDDHVLYFFYKQGSMMDVLDRKIENLLQDWHQKPDMLFSIHPVDGSFLVW